MYKQRFPELFEVVISTTGKRGRSPNFVESAHETTDYPEVVNNEMHRHELRQTIHSDRNKCRICNKVGRALTYTCAQCGFLSVL